VKKSVSVILTLVVLVAAIYIYSNTTGEDMGATPELSDIEIVDSDHSLTSVSREMEETVVVQESPEPMDSSDVVDILQSELNEPSQEEFVEPPKDLTSKEKAIRLSAFLFNSPTTDARTDMFLERYIRNVPEDDSWSGPIRAAVNEHLNALDSGLQDDDESQLECGDAVCILLTRNLDSLGSALFVTGIRDVFNQYENIDVATVSSVQSKKYGVAVIFLSSNFVIPN